MSGTGQVNREFIGRSGGPAIRRALPNTTFADSLAFSRDGRDFKLYSVTGDASPGVHGSGRRVPQCPGSGELGIDQRPVA